MQTQVLLQVRGGRSRRPSRWRQSDHEHGLGQLACFLKMERTVVEIVQVLENQTGELLFCLCVLADIKSFRVREDCKEGVFGKDFESNVRRQVS